MDNKFTVFGLLAVALVAVVLCGSTVFLFQDPLPAPVETEDVEVEVVEGPGAEEETEPIKENIGKELKTTVIKTEVVDKALTEEEKKAREAKDWEEAGKEMNELYQGSKMQELIKKQMTEGNMQWFNDLFEKYNISTEDRVIIAASVTEAQTDYFNELMANGFLKDADEAKRAEVAEKLKAIDKECEDTIIEAGGETFLAEAENRRKDELRDQYLNRVNYRLGKSKMSDEQREAMNELYQSNQVTESEVWTLPKHEVEERKANINDGAKSILNEKQYQRFIKTNSNPFDFK